MKKVIVCGGDGFIGFSLSLYLSNLGHDILILDNLSRRKIDIDLNSNSLTNIKDINTRIKTWYELTKKKIEFINIDLSLEYDKLCEIIKTFNPDTIVHLAEQRSAPYSMKDSKTKRYTVNNNLNATHNILCAIVDVNKDIHLVHLGSTGVYGYSGSDDIIISEGYVVVDMTNQKGEKFPVEILHPAYPGSIYHLTKTQDELFFQFFAKNYKLKLTDLHQAIVYGISTDETNMHPDLVNRFDYDSDYGTVLNRFMMQAVHKIPLTVYGTGQQTRAFIHIKNSMECINIAINNPPKRGDKVKIFNQMTETHTLIDLAKLIQNTFEDVKIQYVDNPRNELVSNDLKVCNNSFLELGLKPILLDAEHLKEIYEFIKSNSQYYDDNIILPSSFWK
jgi:UDP-sulfoquinovose synthase